MLSEQGPIPPTMSFLKTIRSLNPATGELLKEIQTTPASKLPEIFERARNAQAKWVLLSPKKRAQKLLILRETLLNHQEALAEIISKENGKPRFEAIATEILPVLESLTYYAKKTPGLLRDKKIKMGLMKHRASYLNYWPVGVVGIISPWNYPFLLPMGQIAPALAAGNAVIFKPSEVTPLIGLKLQHIFDQAGFPEGILQTIIGDGTLGAELIEQHPNKIVFTGSVGTGKKVMAAAAKHLIPVCLELGGKDAMIVCEDADLDFATSAALWGGYHNSGQVCASVERIIAHESIADRFALMLRDKMVQLRQGNPDGDVDLGVTTFENQKKVYEKQVAEALQKDATFVTGGDFNSQRTFLSPTLVTGAGIEYLEIYNEETFGPVIAMTQFKTVSEAIAKANDSKYGLLASVMTRNIAMGEEIAKQLQVGTVTINEVVYTAGLPETPWGGVKDSGFGRTHSELGLYEFVNVRHIHKPRYSWLVFKSLWWFPYTPHQAALFKWLMETYRRSMLRKLAAVPNLLVEIINLIRKEKRL